MKSEQIDKWILSTQDDDDSRWQTLLNSYNVGTGYLVENHAIPGDYFFVPTEFKALAAEALIRVYPYSHLKDRRRIVLGMFKRALLVNLRDLVPYVINDQMPRFVAHTQVKLNELRFSTLICFEGPNAELAAKSYAKSLGLKGMDLHAKLINPYELATSLGCEVHSVDIHDCQQHPLKG